MRTHMDTRPVITTIIPTYRRPNLLKRAIQSVLNQTYPHFQVIVCDNASGDDTSKTVVELIKNDSRVKYYCHSENLGLIDNFNFGMSKVETEYFSLLSDDDILLPNFYQATLEGFQKYPDAIFSAGEVVKINEEGEFVGAPLSLWPREGLYRPPDGLVEMFGKEPAWTGILFRKEILHRVGFLDPDVGYPCDLDFEIRIASLFPFCISQYPCAILLDHSSSMSTNTRLSTYWMGWYKMINKLMENENVPLNIRLLGKQKLKNQLVGFMFRTRALTRGDFQDAYGTVEILRSVLNEKKKAIILLILTLLTEHVPPIYFLHRILRKKFRSISARMRVKKWRYRFDNYSRYLNK